MNRTTTLREIVRRIEAEYREMPGMKLTAPQAERLWSIDTSTCAAALTALVERRFLRRTADRAYIRDRAS